ncbi:MAG: ATP-binding protein [Lachnospiraceae bacterium]|nr:ATP-binding protein [Lachnospiraceae bacterium]
MEQKRGRQELLEYIKGFCRAYLYERNAKSALWYVAEDIIFLGTADFEQIHGREELEQYLLKDIAEDPRPFELDFEEERIQPIEKNIWVVDLKIRMKTETYELILCLSAVVCEKKDRLMIRHINFSIPTALQDEGEHYPLTFVRENLDKMKENLLNQSIAGGMMGGYIQPDFPFYFVNDPMLEYLGYEDEEEFVRDIEGKISNCMHPDDRSVVDEAVELQLGAGDSYQVEYRMRKKDGTYIWVHDEGRQVIAEDGRDAILSVCYDITGTKEAERALKRSEMISRVALESAKLGVWVFDIRKKKFTIVGPGRKNDFKNGEIDGAYETVLKNGFIMPESQMEFRKMHLELENGKQETGGIFHVAISAAERRWQRIKYIAIPDENGGIDIAIGVSEDITPLMEAKARFDEEVMYRKTIHHKNFSSCKLNLTQNLLESGEGFYVEEMRREGLHSAEEYFTVIGRDVFSEEAEKFRKLFNRKALLEEFSHGSTAIQQENIRKLEDGRGLWLNTAAYLMKKPDTGDVICFVNSQDIGKEKMLQSIMDTIVKTDYEFAVTIEGESGKCTRYSAVKPETCMFCETDEDYEEVIKNYFLKKLPPDRENQTEREGFSTGDIFEYTLPEEAAKCVQLCSLAHIKARLEKEDSFCVVYSRHEQNGNVCQKQLKYSYMNRKDSLLLCTRTDVTGVVEEQNRKNQELKEALEAARLASNAKTDFLSRMSHDIRTPMNAIIGMTDIAKHENPEPEVRDCLDKIDGSSRFLLGLINDVLDISKIESGKFKLRPEPYSVTEFNTSIDTIIRPLMQEKKIQFQCYLEKEVKCVLVDRLRFNQIFFNLLSNAVKFTPEGGTVKFYSVYKGSKNGVANVCFIVEDNGIGMSEEFQKYAFESFEQEINGYIPQFQGTGLGLSIVKELVELMGGTIHMESVLGKGTKISVDLSLELAEPQKEKKEKKLQNAENMLQGKRALLVEDNRINMIVAVKLLKRVGIEVWTAENGKQALELFQGEPAGTFDVILMDIQMPKMDGLEAAGRIRACDHPDAKSIPIIAMSANTYEEDIQKSREAGMNAHLFKPVEPMRLYETLAEYLLHTEQ